MRSIVVNLVARIVDLPSAFTIYLKFVILGQEIIVGISAHTNEAGAHAVARAFPEYATSIVKLPQPFRSLKDAVGVAGINVLAVGESEAAKQLLKV
ncbi:unnamed protein product [Schistosoma curassoni]|uniref:Dimethylargininase n=1 Tax=Schistosoma curassoni TaxID=6186 RepID=A0A183KQM7_9TREM|nr:unnamed protein product [Schistosoma curassoni]